MDATIKIIEKLKQLFTNFFHSILEILVKILFLFVYSTKIHISIIVIAANMNPASVPKIASSKINSTQGITASYSIGYTIKIDA